MAPAQFRPSPDTDPVAAAIGHYEALYGAQPAPEAVPDTPAQDAAQEAAGTAQNASGKAGAPASQTTKREA